MHLENMELSQCLETSRISLSKEESATLMEFESIFDKYKHGLAHANAPFKLFETNCSTSGDEDDEISEKGDRKMRGPYRKYTYDEKMQAVERVLPFFIFRFWLVRMLRSFQNNLAFREEIF